MKNVLICVSICIFLYLIIILGFEAEAFISTIIILLSALYFLPIQKFENSKKKMLEIAYNEAIKKKPNFTFTDYKKNFAIMLCIFSAFSFLNICIQTNEKKSYTEMVVIAPLGAECSSPRSNYCRELPTWTKIKVHKDSLNNTFLKTDRGYFIHTDFVAFENDERYKQAQKEEWEYMQEKEALKKENASIKIK